MAAPQNYSNHTRFDPAFHFFIVPFLIANLVIAITRTVQDWPVQRFLHIWWIVMSVVLLLIAGRGRDRALKAQDRIILLEEKLRYAALLPKELLERSAILTLQQVVALRFASDAELPGLVQRTLTEGLTAKAIKQAIQQWKPDFVRV